MKKIGIMTMNRSYNFGATLQAYALKTYLTKKGHDVEFVRYSTVEQQEMFGYFVKGLRPYAICKNLQGVFHWNKHSRSIKSSQSFAETYLDNLPAPISQLEELKEECQKYDHIIVGSDQMWNIRLRDVGKGYFLPFPIAGTKISYAVSMGDTPPDYAAVKDFDYVQHIKNFDKIAVREASGSEYLKQQGIDSVCVVDPCFLLTPEEWADFAQPESVVDVTDKIVYYSVNPKLKGYQVTKKIGELLKVSIADNYLDPRTEFTGFKKCFDVGPKGFIYNIKNAKYVVTDSFHGTVFSILFKKQFFALFKEDENGNILPSARRMDLLKLLGLQDRAISKSTVDKVCQVKDIDYDAVFEKIKEVKAYSEEFLINSIGE